MSPRTVYYRALPPFARMRTPGGALVRWMKVALAGVVGLVAVAATLVVAVPLVVLSGVLFLIALALGRGRLWKIRRSGRFGGGMGNVFVMTSLDGAPKSESRRSDEEAVIVEVETLDKRIER